MKKLLALILINCFLGSVSAKADCDVFKAYDDVDEAFKCFAKVNEDTLIITGYFRGIWYMASLSNNTPSNDYTINASCLKKKTMGDIIDRFEVLYRRNHFQIGEYTPIAVIKTLQNLCPL